VTSTTRSGAWFRSLDATISYAGRDDTAQGPIERRTAAYAAGNPGLATRIGESISDHPAVAARDGFALLRRT
jgi:hypothetical protein